MTDPVHPFALTGLTRSNATIQANRPILLRGTASPGQAVHAQLGQSHVHTTADAQGQWRCFLPPLPPGGPHSGQVTSSNAASGEARIPLDNLLSGQVWLCAGQSNMAMSLASLEIQELPLPNPHDPLRFVHIPVTVSAVPLSDTAIQWQHPTLTPKTASGIAYHFAQTLHDRLQTPVAFIQAAVGHTPAMSWTPRNAIAPASTAAQRLNQFDLDLLAQPDALSDLNKYRKTLEGPWSQWNKAITAWQSQSRAQLAAGQTMAPMPPRATGLGDTHTPTVLYNAMLAPLQDEPIAGILWYQGESDAILGLAGEYPQSLASLIHGMRQTFGHVPIVIVELPRHFDIQCDNPDDAWPTVRWAQQSALADPAIGVVPSLDQGDTIRIHPIQKRIVAHRAAEIALALAYPQHPSHSHKRRHGPILHRASFTGYTVELVFTGVHESIVINPSPASNAARFEVLIGQTWQTITPTFTAPCVVQLTTSQPALAARYAWAADPIPTLFDASGYPVSPFVVRAAHTQ